MLRRTYDPSYFDSVLFRTKAASQRNRKRIQLILSRRPAGELLEIGCGKGHLLQLASHSFSVSGFELSGYATQALDPAVRERITIADIERVSLPTSQYDVVVAFNVLEHLESPGPVLKGICQALKPEGVLVGSVPLKHSLVGHLHTALTNVFDRTHRSTLSLRKWQQAFRAAGFPEQDLFGEIQLGPNHALYVRTPAWQHISLNLVFVLAGEASLAGSAAA
ncbi:MAG: class I SAM-dependent methyltransferase [Anaerolineales bacterium]|nr:class I SAM-dependent methyltransferase [Anaerolineales bacterium]